MIVAHYEVGEVIGGGGMGTVYSAVDTRFARKVAVKVLHPHLARNPEVVRRFRTEAVIGAKLSHPHVVRVYDVLEADGVVGFVMERVDGKSLDRLLAGRPGGLPLEEALRLFRQVVSGVAHAHAAGLVHRDIKPSNVLVEVVDGELHAKVTDFGVAKVVGGETRLTGMGAKIGTLAYMSPEQIDDPASVDARSDVYALGVLAYEMLTGEVPFDMGTEFEVMRRILERELRLHRMDDKATPIWLSDAIKRCLGGPDVRFVDARALLHALSPPDGVGGADIAQSRGAPELQAAAAARSRSAERVVGDAIRYTILAILAGVALLVGINVISYLRNHRVW